MKQNSFNPNLLNSNFLNLNLLNKESVQQIIGSSSPAVSAQVTSGWIRFSSKPRSVGANTLALMPTNQALFSEQPQGLARDVFGMSGVNSVAELPLPLDLSSTLDTDYLKKAHQDTLRLHKLSLHELSLHKPSLYKQSELHGTKISEVADSEQCSQSADSLQQLQAEVEEAGLSTRLTKDAQATKSTLTVITDGLHLTLRSQESYWQATVQVGIEPKMLDAAQRHALILKFAGISRSLHLVQPQLLADDEGTTPLFHITFPMPLREAQLRHAIRALQTGHQLYAKEIIALCEDKQLAKTYVKIFMRGYLRANSAKQKEKDYERYNTPPLEIFVSDTAKQRSFRIKKLPKHITIAKFISESVSRMGLDKTTEGDGELGFQAYLKREARHLNPTEITGHVLKPQDEVILQPDIQAG